MCHEVPQLQVIPSAGALGPADPKFSVWEPDSGGDDAGPPSQS